MNLNLARGTGWRETEEKTRSTDSWAVEGFSSICKPDLITLDHSFLVSFCCEEF